jgi:hypothetical protein
MEKYNTEGRGIMVSKDLKFKAQTKGYHNVSEEMFCDRRTQESGHSPSVCEKSEGRGEDKTQPTFILLDFYFFSLHHSIFFGHNFPSPPLSFPHSNRRSYHLHTPHILDHLSQYLCLPTIRLNHQR